MQLKLGEHQHGNQGEIAGESDNLNECAVLRPSSNSQANGYQTAYKVANPISDKAICLQKH